MSDEKIRPQVLDPEVQRPTGPSVSAGDKRVSADVSNFYDPFWIPGGTGFLM